MLTVHLIAALIDRSAGVGAGWGSQYSLTHIVYLLLTVVRRLRGRHLVDARGLRAVLHLEVLDQRALQATLLLVLRLLRLLVSCQCQCHLQVKRWISTMSRR